MEEIVEMACPCGRVLRRKGPAPGERVRCYYCGRETALGEAPADGPGEVGDASRELLAALRAQGPLEPAPTHCPSCSAALEIDTGALDAGGVRCAHCGTTVALPGRGASHERVHEGEGTRTVERVSVWEGPGGAPDADAAGAMEDLLREIVGERPDGEGELTSTTRVEHVELDLDGEDAPEVIARLLRRG